MATCGLKAKTKRTRPTLFKFAKKNVFVTRITARKVIMKIKKRPHFGLKTVIFAKVVVFLLENPGCVPYLEAYFHNWGLKSKLPH